MKYYLDLFCIAVAPWLAGLLIYQFNAPIWACVSLGMVVWRLESVMYRIDS